jgi:hypothetical protein
MSPLGRLLRNRRAGETHTAWNLPTLQGPEPLTLTSRDFGDGGAIPLANCAKTIGGDACPPTSPGPRSHPAPHNFSWSSRTSTYPSPNPPCTASP